MVHKVWSGIEEVPYYFPRSSIKFQGYWGTKIDDLVPISVLLDDNSQFEFMGGYEMTHISF